jgi:PHD/YefM family antitoxin component YafN of YafNO toxin-antitoxin module
MDVMPQFHPQYVTDSEGHKKAVILPIEEYEELLEDLGDLAIAAERRNEPTISHEQLLAELRSDGLLPD